MATMVLTGRLGRDAELKDFGGKKCLKFSVAYDVGYGAKKETVWVSCSMWGDRGEKLSQYLKKGAMVEVVGTPSVRVYEKDGVAKASLDLNVSDLKLYGGGAKQSSDNSDNIPF
jgi:single-strand DNA-binding protein